MAQDYLRQSQSRRGTGGGTTAHGTRNLSDAQAQCPGLFDRGHPVLSSAEAGALLAQTTLRVIRTLALGLRRAHHVNDYSRCDSESRQGALIINRKTDQRQRARVIDIREFRKATSEL